MGLKVLSKPPTFLGCEELLVDSSTIIVKAASRDAAHLLFEQHFDFFSQVSFNLGKKKVAIFYDSTEMPLTIFPSQDTSPISKESLNQIVIPELSISLNESYSSDKAVWIIEQTSQAILFANPVALQANKRKLTDVLNKEITPLWEDEELAKLMRYLRRDKSLKEYQNPGFRWSGTPDEPWRRDPYQFTVDYQVIEFMGLSCRYEVVQDAVRV
jgi:hypothetical protein